MVYSYGVRVDSILKVTQLPQKLPGCVSDRYLALRITLGSSFSYDPVPSNLNLANAFPSVRARRKLEILSHFVPVIILRDCWKLNSKVLHMLAKHVTTETHIWYP